MECHTVDRERRFCLNPSCAVESWVFRSWLGHTHVWWAALQVGDAPWTAAASAPFCISCGATLRTATELQREMRSGAADIGEYAASLPDAE